jgi:uncharacterized protein YdeI (YjbR/CyaY-like superfamily)
LAPKTRATKLKKLKPKAFKTASEFREWLRTNHNQSDALWMRLYRRVAGKTSITYAEALDQALCFGWIDGQKKPYDDRSWLQRFTPRTKRSSWSKNNTLRIEQLTGAGLMTPAGLKVVAEAKADGRWQAAYDSFSRAVPSEDLVAALAQNRPARLCFEGLNKTNVYAIVYRLQTAKKPETRARRLKLLIEMLERGETVHPQRKRN